MYVLRSRARSGLRVLAGERQSMPSETIGPKLVSLCGELSCDSKLKITKDLVTQLKITQHLLTLNSTQLM